MKLVSEKIDVSVIMPTYNQATFVLGAINSLLSQSYTNWELIIVNDVYSPLGINFNLNNI